jgi:hypothetical protein
MFFLVLTICGTIGGSYTGPNQPTQCAGITMPGEPFATEDECKAVGIEALNGRAMSKIDLVEPASKHPTYIAPNVWWFICLKR